MSLPNYTVGWLCNCTESRVAATAFLDTVHDTPITQHQHDTNNYLCGTIGKHGVAISAPADFGIASTAVMVANMRRAFPCIEFFLLVGIAGGTASEDHDIRLGDVVVGTHGVLRHALDPPQLGQQPPEIFQDAITRLMKNQELGAMLKRHIETALEKKKRLQGSYKRPPTRTDELFFAPVSSSLDEADQIVLRQPRLAQVDQPVVHYGVVASGDTPVQCPHMRDCVAARHNVLCFDTESAGVINRQSLVIRGIYNYSDSHKNDIWLGYAAMAAAAYAKALLAEVDFTRKWITMHVR